MTMESRIAAGDVMLELPFDIGEKARRAYAEQLRFEPLAAEFFLHQDLVFEHRLGGGHATRWLEADHHARALKVVADHAHHRGRDGEGRVHAFLAGGRLD